MYRVHIQKEVATCLPFTKVYVDGKQVAKTKVTADNSFDSDKYDKDLYESLFDSAVGVTYNDFTESVVSSYETDTNGILPDLVEGWIAAALVAALTYFGGEIIATGTYALETIATWLTAGYQWLIGSATTVIIQLNKAISKVRNYAWDEWIGTNIDKISGNWQSFENQLIAIGNNGGLAVGETVPLSSNSIQMILGMFLVSDTLIHTPGKLAELSEDLENNDGSEFLTDTLIELYAPLPFTQIDDNYFDEILGGNL